MAARDDYICTLDKTFIKKARDELNENPEDRLAAVQALRGWIKEQPHIKCPQTDTIFLLRFLRWAKFSQVRAREKLELYLSLPNSIPPLYRSIDSGETTMQDLINAGYVFFLKQHPNGNPVFVLRQVVAMGLDYSAYTRLRTSATLIEYLQTKELNQICGIILIIDYTGIEISNTRKLMNREFSSVFKEWMKCSTGRFKNVHMYRAGVIVELILTFFKPLLKSKLYDKIVVNETMESLYKYVPMECLPIEYLPDNYTGPSAGTIHDCTKRTKEAISEKDFREDLLYRTSDAFGIDMSKKPETTVTGHFRKLNVD